MAQTKITFLGMATVVPGAGEDSASFLINDTILFDCGWNSAVRMQQYGYSPLNIETLFLTHCHHDHYMGLPGLLFFRSMRSRSEERQPLQIVGPADDLPIVTELSCQFLQTARFPELEVPTQLHPLEPGSTYETDAFRIETIRALHPVTGFCGRFTDKQTSTVIAFSGDTGPNPALVELARDADLLIHEASIAPDVPDERLRGDHSRATDAARIARDGGVSQLRLIHIANHREASLAAAQEIFPNTALANEGETITW